MTIIADCCGLDSGLDSFWRGWTSIDTMSPFNRALKAVESPSTAKAVKATAADTGPPATVDIQTLDQFLASVERRAFRMAQVSAGDREAALDIVQDAMMKLVQSYSERPAVEWRPLFFRILNNRITDWHRSQSSRWAIFDRWFGGDEEQGVDAMDQLEGSHREQPDQQLLAALSLQQIEAALQTLSPRQQQVFMLRCWEGLSTQETAQAMDCSEGTVKTLYSRALTGMRVNLGEDDE